MPAPVKHDWSAAEEYFMESDSVSRVSLKEVSEKLGIPYHSVRRYAAKHRWHDNRTWKWVFDREGYVDELIEKLYATKPN